MFHVADGLDDDSTADSGGCYLRYYLQEPVGEDISYDAYVEFVIRWIRIEFKTVNAALQVRTRFGGQPWTNWKDLI